MAGLVTDQLNKFGPFGKYNGVTTILAASGHDFSSGSLGASAFIVSGSMNGYANLARGGTLRLEGLQEGELYEIGVASVYTGLTTIVYVLQR